MPKVKIPPSKVTVPPHHTFLMISLKNKNEHQLHCCLISINSAAIGTNAVCSQKTFLYTYSINSGSVKLASNVVKCIRNDHTWVYKKSSVEVVSLSLKYFGCVATVELTSSSCFCRSSQCSNWKDKL